MTTSLLTRWFSAHNATNATHLCGFQWLVILCSLARETTRAVRVESPVAPGPRSCCVQCYASAGPPSPPTPAPLPVLYRMGIKATGSSRLAATDYITEPMEPKLKEEIILPPLNSPNPSLSLPCPPHTHTPPLASKGLERVPDF